MLIKNLLEPYTNDVEIKHYLYIIYDTVTGEIKFGETQNPQGRKRQLTKQRKRAMWLLYQWIVDIRVAKELEDRIHTILREFRVKSETGVYSDWFNMEPTQFEYYFGLPFVTNPNYLKLEEGRSLLTSITTRMLTSLFESRWK